jgi:hypothetical protein
MAFVVGCGCSNSPMVPPAYGYVNDAKDVWPALYGVDNGGPDNGYFICYDQNASAWQAPRLIAADLLDSQWTPQRNSIGWQGSDAASPPGGIWNCSFIEDTSNDLEIWVSPDTGWQDDAGAWGLLDDDASQDWLAVDVETRQNYVWLGAYRAAPTIDQLYVDLAAGVPAITGISNIQGNGGLQFSLCIEKSLIGYWDVVYNDGVNIDTESITPGGSRWKVPVTIIASGEYPQLIIDNEERMWTFLTDTNVLRCFSQMNIPGEDFWDIETSSLYTATALSSDYHATWLKMDDTIHVALVDANVFGNTLLVYLRRTPNGWVEQETLLTVDTLNTDDLLTWPQITVDTLGNIFIYYIFADDWTVTAAGDLRGFYLDAANYSNPIAASWTAHTNIDQSADLVEWVVAPDSIPISADM